MTQAATPLLLERIQATSTPVAMPQALEAGRLVQWLKRPGDQVERYEPLAEIETHGLATELTATTSGVIKALMVREGATIQRGGVLCYIQPAVPLTHTSRTSPEHPRALPTCPPVKPAPPVREIAPALASERRSTLGVVPPAPVEVLTVEERPPAKPIRGSGTRRPTPTLQRGKTTHKTYHLEESQVQRIKRLTLELQLDEQEPMACNESELIRAAVEMLLDLPRPALIAVLQTNREREKAGRYGSGWPRPRRP